MFPIAMKVNPLDEAKAGIKKRWFYTDIRPKGASHQTVAQGRHRIFYEVRIVEMENVAIQF